MLEGNKTAVIVGLGLLGLTVNAYSQRQKKIEQQSADPLPPNFNPDKLISPGDNGREVSEFQHLINTAAKDFPQFTIWTTAGDPVNIFGTYPDGNFSSYWIQRLRHLTGSSTMTINQLRNWYRNRTGKVMYSDTPQSAYYKDPRLERYGIPYNQIGKILKRPVKGSAQCTDGNFTSLPGPGSCSYHKGLKKKGAKTSRKKAPAKAPRGLTGSVFKGLAQIVQDPNKYGLESGLAEGIINLSKAGKIWAWYNNQDGPIFLEIFVPDSKALSSTNWNLLESLTKWNPERGLYQSIGRGPNKLPFDLPYQLGAKEYHYLNV